MDNRKVLISHRIMPDDLQLLNAEAKRRRTSRSDILRRMIDAYRRTMRQDVHDAVKMLA